jgi:tetratricopeptide (TPR) repeat protein
MSNNVIDAEQWLQKGDDYFKLQKYSDAIEYYDKALEIEPKYVSALNGKGYVLGLLQKYEEAIKYIDKALEIDQEFSYAWNEKGNVLYDWKKYEDAINCYDDLEHRQDSW